MFGSGEKKLITPLCWPDLKYTVIKKTTKKKRKEKWYVWLKARVYLEFLSDSNASQGPSRINSRTSFVDTFHETLFLHKEFSY